MKKIRKKRGFTLQNFSKKNLGGFTLIELLVVIAIIGILAAIVLVALGGAKDRAKDARIIADMGQLRSTAEIYFGNHNESYANLCTDTDVLALKDDITAQKGTWNTCDAPGDTYCIQVTLNSGATWCIDSKLTSVQNKTCGGAPLQCQ